MKMNRIVYLFTRRFYKVPWLFHEIGKAGNENKYTIEEVLDACRYYFNKTGRRITFEYSLVAGVNDTIEEADKLGRLVSDLNCHVNLIPVNPIKEREYRQSAKQAVLQFKSRVEKYKINATIRREMGRDINGACGQLRNEAMSQRKEDLE